MAAIILNGLLAVKNRPGHVILSDAKNLKRTADQEGEPEILRVAQNDIRERLFHGMCLASITFRIDGDRRLPSKGECFMSTEENKAIVRQIEEAWDSGNLDALDNLFAPDFLAHNAVPGMPSGLQGAKMAHLGSVQAMPDRRTYIEDMLAEGDYVVARVRMTGTNKGGFPWLGIPANGNRVDIQWTSIYRLANGKIVEHRAVMDMLGLLQQLGAVPAPA